VRAADEAGSACADMIWPETNCFVIGAGEESPPAAGGASSSTRVRDLQRGRETDKGWRRVCNARRSRATSTETELSNYTLTDSVYRISAVEVILLKMVCAGISSASDWGGGSAGRAVSILGKSSESSLPYI
jgi:hypothetical protein